MEPEEMMRQVGRVLKEAQSEGREDYVCPQCGPDPNGSEVHAMTHHTLPPYSDRSAIEIVSLQAEVTRLQDTCSKLSGKEMVLSMERDKLAEDKKRMDWLEDHLNAGVGRDNNLRLVGDGVTEVARAPTLRTALDVAIGLEVNEVDIEIKAVAVDEDRKLEITADCSECGNFFVPESSEDTKCKECLLEEAEKAHDNGECVENCPICAEERGEGAIEVHGTQ